MEIKLMQQTSPLAVRVGIFFTIAVLLALGLSLQAGKGLFGGKNYDIVANFQQSFGIDPGTKVALRGVPIGQIHSMDWDAGRYRVRVVLRIDQRYEIPRNAVAKIQISSLLGGNFINISIPEGVGPAEMAYLRMGDEILTEETPSLDEVLQVFNDLSADGQNLIRNLDANQERTMAKINTILDENQAYFNETSQSFARLGPELETLAERLNLMTESVQQGEGTLGLLFSDRELYDQLREFSDKANQVADQIASGEGDIGRLIFDDALTTEAREIMAELQRAAREIEAAIGENREGLRQMVDSFASSGPEIQAAIANFNEISEKINAGEGTLGKLVNDPSLFEDARRAVNQVGESFESGEEQGVFRSFFGLLFGALI